MELTQLKSLNVYGQALQYCSLSPKTGFVRDGYCQCLKEDPGQHTICVQVTDDFLQFSKDQGNDLSTARPEYEFEGLVAGQQWCLCLSRWIEAYEAGVAPKVVLAATHQSVLEKVDLQTLETYSV
ncbi:MAG: DUF2237 domain-containing protein [bacterium]